LNLPAMGIWGLCLIDTIPMVIYGPAPMAALRKKLSTTVYITEEQNEKLKALNEKTKVPIAEYIRQGIDLILERHKDELPGEQLGLYDVGKKK